MSERAVTKRKQLPGLIDIATVREKALVAAGVTLAEMAAMVQESLTVMRQALTADKETVLQWEGRVVDVHRAPDHATRLKAAQALMATLGVAAQRWNTHQAEPEPTDKSVKVVINLGGEAPPLEAKVVTPTGTANRQGVDVTPGGASHENHS